MDVDGSGNGSGDGSGDGHRAAFVAERRLDANGRQESSRWSGRVEKDPLVDDALHS